MDSWLYDDNKPFVHLKFQAVYDELREGLSKGYFHHRASCPLTVIRTSAPLRCV